MTSGDGPGSGNDGGRSGGEPPTGGQGSGGAAPAKKQRSIWKELPLLIGIGGGRGGGRPTCGGQQGDRVLVDKLTPWFGSEPERGEVVVFHDPDQWLAGQPAPDPNALQTFLSWIGLMPSSEEKDLIKRVIGVGGDTVECKGTGPLTVNGKALNEPYVYPGNTPCSQDDQGGQFKVKIPQGFIWVMGDHRQNSRDSRYNQSDKNHGMVPVDKVVGRAVVIAWPISRWDNLPVPDTFDQHLSARSAAPVIAPPSLALAGAVPLVLWRRQRVKAAETR